MYLWSLDRILFADPVVRDIGVNLLILWDAICLMHIDLHLVFANFAWKWDNKWWNGYVLHLNFRWRSNFKHFSFTRPSSFVNFSHFPHLLWKYWANFDQTWYALILGTRAFLAVKIGGGGKAPPGALWVRKKW